MLAFLARRLLSTIPVLLIVSVLVFLLLRLTPGDPAAILAGDQATSEQIAQIRTNLGLDRSIVEQYLIWASHLLQGDLGQSFYYKTDVVSLIGQRLEPTLSLTLNATSLEWHVFEREPHAENIYRAEKQNKMGGRVGKHCTRQRLRTE